MSQRWEMENAAKYCSSRGIQRVRNMAAFSAPLTVVEGAYACHPALWDSYDLRVFLTVDAAEQLRRIEARSGPEKLRMFRDRWIPLEESYFAAFDLPARCDMALKG